jgi:hypothetical protein
MNKLNTTGGILLLLAVVFQNVNAQNELQTVLAQDSLFWRHFNACQVDEMGAFVMDDLEFYHDRNGLMKGRDSFLSTSRRNLCGNENFHIRREPVAGSIKIFPMKEGEKLYGAVLYGQHVFYVVEQGKAPRLDGLARFTHLWLKTESGWRMSRILSYDHGPAPYINKRKEVTLTRKILQRHAGRYQAPQSGLCVVDQADGLLLLRIGSNTFKLHPESETVFFSTDRDLTFEFKDDKMIVKEFGKIAEEARRVK